MLTERISEALALAVQAHEKQVRKGTSIPYVAHPMGVASIALEFGLTKIRRSLRCSTMYSKMGGHSTDLSSKSVSVSESWPSWTDVPTDCQMPPARRRTGVRENGSTWSTFFRHRMTFCSSRAPTNYTMLVQSSATFSRLGLTCSFASPQVAMGPFGTTGPWLKSLNDAVLPWQPCWQRK